MESARVVRMGLAVAIAIGVAAVSAAFWMSKDQQSLPVSELLRIEPPIDTELSPVHAGLAWTFDLISDRRVLSDDDFDLRLGEPFQLEDNAAGLRAEIDRMQESFGQVEFHRMTGLDDDLAEAVGIGSSGRPIVSQIEVDEEGRISWWLLTDPSPGPRLPPWHTALILLGGWAFVGAAALAIRALRNSTAAALVVGAALVFSQVLTLSDGAGPHLVGRMAPMLVLPMAVWLLLDIGDGDGGRWLVVPALVVAIVGGGAVLMVDPARVGHPTLPLLADDPDAYELVSVGVYGMTATVMTVLASIVVGRRRSWRMRRDPTPWFAVAAAGLWAMVSAAGTIDLASGSGVLAGDMVPAGWAVTVALVPVGSGLAAVFRHWDRSDLADLVVDLEGAGADLQPAVARALGDESLRLWRWSDTRGTLVDRSGREMDSGVGDGRSRTYIRSGGEVVGVLDHDASLLRRPERLRAVAAAVGMALRVERLNARVTAQLEEVRASRTRIVSAGDVARRKVERDLHDGAQQRLVALGLLLQRSRRLAEAGVEQEVRQLLDQASSEVREALAELRQVSRGMHPALLSERGLESALEGLAERLPIEVEATVTSGRFPAEVELASYYVVAEALTNVAKHAGTAEARVAVEQSNGELRIAVTDDGRGGACMTAGSGLEGLADRVAAVGGWLTVNSPSGGGTRVEAVIPCR